MYTISKHFKKPEGYKVVIIVDKVKNYEHVQSLNLNEMKGSLCEEFFKLEKKKLLRNVYSTKQIKTWNTGFIVRTTLVTKIQSFDLILLKRIFKRNYVICIIMY